MKVVPPWWYSDVEPGPGTNNHRGSRLTYVWQIGLLLNTTLVEPWHSLPPSAPPPKLHNLSFWTFFMSNLRLGNQTLWCWTFYDDMYFTSHIRYLWTYNIPNSLVHTKNLHCETGWYTSEMSLNCIQILGRSPGFTILQTLALHPCYVSLHNRMGNVLYTAMLPHTWMLQHVLRLWKWKHCCINLGV